VDIVQAAQRIADEMLFPAALLATLETRGA